MKQVKIRHIAIRVWRKNNGLERPRFEVDIDAVEEPSLLLVVGIGTDHLIIEQGREGHVKEVSAEQSQQQTAEQFVGQIHLLLRIG